MKSTPQLIIDLLMKYREMIEDAQNRENRHDEWYANMRFHNIRELGFRLDYGDLSTYI